MKEYDMVAKCFLFIKILLFFLWHICFSIICYGDQHTEECIEIYPTLPVILSSSTHNLLYENGNIAFGSIIVKNNSHRAVKKFRIKNTVYPLIVDSNSSCFNSVASGDTCEFKVSYIGSPFLPFKTSVTFEVMGEEYGDERFSDCLVLNVINKETAGFFNSAIDDSDIKNLPVSRITSFAVINKNGIDFLCVGTTNGVFKTSDGGKTWIPINTGLEGTVVQALQMIDDCLYAGTNNGVFKTKNSGASWTKVNNGSANINVTSLHSMNGYLYVGTSDGYIFKFKGTKNYCIRIDKDMFNGQEILALNSLNGHLYVSTLYGIYKTNNEGITWLPAHKGLVWDSGLLVKTLYVMGHHLYAGTNNGVFKIDDNGEYWTCISNSLVSVNVKALCSMDGDLYIGTWDSGIFKTNNIGETWNAVNGGLISRRITSLFSLNGIMYAGTEIDGVFKTENAGIRWEAVNNGVVRMMITALRFMNGYLYIGTWYDGVFISNNDGKYISVFSDGLSNKAIQAFGEMGSYLYVGTHDGIFRIKDNTTVWESINDGLEDTDILALYVMNGCIYAGTARSGIFIFEYDKKIWKPINDNEGLPHNKRVHTLASMGNYLYAGIRQEVYKTNDNGKIWSKVNGLPKSWIYDLHFVKNHLYAATDEGIFKLGSSDTEWVIANDESMKIPVFALCSTDDYLYAATAKGVFRTNNEGITWELIDDKLKDYVFNLYSINDRIYAGTVHGTFVYKEKPTS